MEREGPAADGTKEPELYWPSPLTLTVEGKAGGLLQLAAFGPKAAKVIAPVALDPPESVALSEIALPSDTVDDACVVSVGAAATTAVLASALSFSEFGSDDEVIDAVLV